MQVKGLSVMDQFYSLLCKLDIGKGVEVIFLGGGANSLSNMIIVVQKITKNGKVFEFPTDLIIGNCSPSPFPPTTAPVYLGDFNLNIFLCFYCLDPSKPLRLCLIYGRVSACVCKLT